MLRNVDLGLTHMGATMLSEAGCAVVVAAMMVGVAILRTAAAVAMSLVAEEGT